METKKQAPDAQKILESKYCPSSFSSVSNILPLQNGYPYLSIKPPEAPAYSKKTYLNYRNSLIMMTKNLPLKDLLLTLLLRIILDIVSSFRLLIKGEISNFIALYKAHFDYFNVLGLLLKERDNSSKKSNYFKINSIVYKYFILGKKKFFQL